MSSIELNELSFRELQQLAKQHGISAKQKMVQLIAALTPILAATTTTSSTSRKRSAGQAELATEESESVVQPTQGGGRKSKKSKKEDDADENVTESVAPAPAAPAVGGRKSKKSKVNDTNVNSSEEVVVPMDTTEDDAPPVVQKDRVTKRGRRKNVRVTDGISLESVDEPTAAAAAAASSTSNSRPSNGANSNRNSLNEANAGGSRRATKNTTVTTPVHHPPTPTNNHSSSSSPSTSPARPRPSLAPSARKRWSHAPVAIFGTTVFPPSRGSGGGTVNPAVREGYQAEHSRATASPSKRSGNALLAAAQRLSGSSAAAGRSPSAHFSSPAAAATTSSLSALASPTLNLPLSTSSTVPNARAKTSTSSRLSFTRFPGPNEPISNPTPSKLPGNLFDTNQYHPATSTSESTNTGVGRFTMGAKVSKPSTLSSLAAPKAAIKGRQTMGPTRTKATSNTATAAATTSSTAATATSSTTTAPSSSLFSTKARVNRLGTTQPAMTSSALTGASTTRAPLGSPVRPNLAATQPLSSLSRPTTANTAASARGKFDLAASLQRPVGWQMKKGAVKPTTSTSSTVAVPPGAVSSNPNRTTQLKKTEFASLKPAQQKQQQQRTTAARQEKLQQGRSAATSTAASTGATTRATRK